MPCVDWGTGADQSPSVATASEFRWTAIRLMGPSALHGREIGQHLVLQRTCAQVVRERGLAGD